MKHISVNEGEIVRDLLISCIESWRSLNFPFYLDSCSRSKYFYSNRTTDYTVTPMPQAEFTSVYEIVRTTARFITDTNAPISTRQ